MKEMLKRAGRTFLQAAVGYIFTAASGLVSSPDGIQGNVFVCLAIAGIAAGLAAVMNLPLKNDD